MARMDQEKLLHIEGDHFTICGLSDARGHPDLRLQEELQALLEDAVMKVKDRTQSCT